MVFGGGSARSQVATVSGTVLHGRPSLAIFRRMHLRSTLPCRNSQPNGVMVHIVFSLPLPRVPL